MSASVLTLFTETTLDGFPLWVVLLSAAHCLPLIPHWPRLPSRKAALSWTGIMGTSACWNHLAAKNGF